MIDSLNMGKRALTTAVAAATMLWSIGFSSFVAPLTAHAAMSGDLIKGQTLSTVYYYGSDGKRYAFPNEKTYFSWYADFSTVQTMSDSQLAAIALGGNVVQRPGSYWVKIQSDPKTYAVAPNGTLRWIETEAVATGLAGANWNKFVNDVPDVFFADYTVGASLTSAANAYNGALLKAADGTYYEVWNGQKRLVSSAGFSANSFQSRFALSGSGVNLAGITAGTDVTAKESALSDTAQLPASAIATTGGLSVSLASDTPAAMTVPSKATSVTFLKFNLMSDADATLSGVTIKQAGVGGTTTVSNVYLYDGSTRLTNGRTINSSSRQATFSGLSLALKAGQTKTLSVVVDMATNSTGGDTIQFQLLNAAAVTSTATVSGSFPITGATMTTSSTAVGTLTVNKSGTIVQPVLGSKQAKISEFKLTSATEGATVNQLRLDIRDASKHSNYNLYQNNALVASGTRYGTDKVDFAFSTPFVIDQGSNKIFEVRADIGGQNNDTIKTAIEETTDVKAVGSKFGFNMSVDIATSGTYNNTGSACTSASTSCSYTTIKGGKITIAFNGPTSKRVKPSTQSVSVWDGTITSQNNVTIRQLRFTFVGAGGGLTGPAANNYQSIRLVNKATGQTISGPYEFASGVSATAGTVNMTDNWNMTAGQSVDVSVLVDVKGTTGDFDVTSADTIAATYVAAQFQARDSNNQDLTVGTDIVPNADLAGYTHTINTASLSVALSQPPTSATYVKGKQNVDMLGISFIAGSATLVKVSAVTFSGYGEDAGTFSSTPVKNLNPQTYITSCSIYDGNSGALISGPESFSGTFTSPAALNVTFSGFSWTIPAGETGKMLARCNFANVAVGSSTNDIWALEINANANITAVDGSGDSIATITGATTVNTTPTIAQTIASVGTLAVTQDGSTPKSTIILGSSTAVPVAVFKFQASTEDFVVKTLSLGNCLTATTGCNATVTSASTFTNNSETVTIVVGGNTATLTESATASAASAALSAITFSCTTDATTCAGNLVTAINANTLLAALVKASNVAGVVTITQISGTSMLVVSSSNAATWTVVTPTLGADQIASAVKLSYQDASGATVTKSGTFSGGKVKFSDLNFNVTTTSTKTMSVSVDTNTVATTGATTGSRLAVNFIVSDFDASGAASGTSLTHANVSQALGNPMAARKTKPTISLATGSPSGAGIPGLAELLRFSVGADSRGFVKLNQITLKVTATNNGSSTWRTPNGAQLAVTGSWNIYDASAMDTAITYNNAGNSILQTTGAVAATTDVMAFWHPIFSTAEQIGAGTSKTYVVKVDTTGASSGSHDSIRLDFVDQASLVTATTGVARNALSWDDDVLVVGPQAGSTGADASASTQDGTITNGTFVKNLPVTGGTIVY